MEGNAITNAEQPLRVASCSRLLDVIKTAQQNGGVYFTVAENIVEGGTTIIDVEPGNNSTIVGSFAANNLTHSPGCIREVHVKRDLQNRGAYLDEVALGNVNREGIVRYSVSQSGARQPDEQNLPEDAAPSEVPKEKGPETEPLNPSKKENEEKPGSPGCWERTIKPMRGCCTGIFKGAENNCCNINFHVCSIC